MHFIQRFDPFYQNNQFMNFELYQRFPQGDSLISANDKCLYCCNNNQIFKKNCSLFQKKITAQQIYIVNWRNLLGPQRSKIFQMLMWMKRNQRECVKFFEKFLYFIHSFAFVFAINFDFDFVFSLSCAVAHKVNIISINIDFLKKLSFDEKNDLEIVILNYMSNIKIITSFVAVVQVLKKNAPKKK